jgi:hypothetical protein
MARSGCVWSTPRRFQIEVADEDQEDTITFNSGRKAHATLGIVGINSQLELSEGYDRRIDWPVPKWWK